MRVVCAEHPRGDLVGGDAGVDVRALGLADAHAGEIAADRAGVVAGAVARPPVPSSCALEAAHHQDVLAEPLERLHHALELEVRARWWSGSTPAASCRWARRRTSCAWETSGALLQTRAAWHPETAARSRCLRLGATFCGIGVFMVFLSVRCGCRRRVDCWFPQCCRRWLRVAAGFALPHLEGHAVDDAVDQLRRSGRRWPRSRGGDLLDRGPVVGFEPRPSA